jgi:hypothetical protein
VPTQRSRRNSPIRSGETVSGDCQPANGPEPRKRRVFRWSKEARDLVREYLQRAHPAHPGQPNKELKVLVTKLADATGYPRDACLRFVRQLGVAEHNPYQKWTENDKQRLLDLSARFPLKEVARLLRRSYSSVRSRLHNLGATAQMGRDWFTLYVLAEALHISADEVQRWIDRGWLKCRYVRTGTLQRVIITADDFSEFCTSHREQLVGRRINQERLEFVRTFVFPPSHADLLPVRASKKERAAYDEQNQAPPRIGPAVERDEPSEAAG